MIDTPIDFFLVSKRGAKMDCRQFFAYCFLFVSIVALLAILAMKIALHLSGQDDNAFDTVTNTDGGEEGTDTLSILVSAQLYIFSRFETNPGQMLS